MDANKVIIFSILTAAVLTAAVCYLFWHNTVLPSGEETTSLAQEKQNIQILIVGDLMFDRNIRAASQEKGNDFIFEKISQTLLNNDLVVANLEGPITNEQSVSLGTNASMGTKDSLTFTFDPSLAETLFKQNIKLVNLGNNHILNFGEKGAELTQQYLNQAGVDFFGVPGKERSIIKDVNGIKIAFVSYNIYSANTKIEQSKTIDEIKKVKLNADIVVVFNHWGVEFKLVPSEAMVNLAHQFVDAGADLVVGSHTHTTETTEVYKGKKIYYSLGNFIFDQYFDENVRNGLGVIVRLNKATKQMEFSEKRFYLDANGQTVEKF